MKHKLILAGLFAMALACAQPQTLHAQQPYVTDDEVKVNTYKQFVDNRVPNPAAAYQAAQKYMKQFKLLPL